MFNILTISPASRFTFNADADTAAGESQFALTMPGNIGPNDEIVRFSYTGTEYTPSLFTLGIDGPEKISPALQQNYG